MNIEGKSSIKRNEKRIHFIVVSLLLIVIVMHGFYSESRFKPITPADAASNLSPIGSWSKIPDLPRYINTIIKDPTNSKVLYASTGYGSGGYGIYKSEDAGLTWSLSASKGLPDKIVMALAFSQEAHPTLYAIVGPDGDIYASIDGAQNWAYIGNNPELCCNFGRRLYVSPMDGRVLFAVTIGGGGGASRSRDGGQNWLPIKDERGYIGARSLAIDSTDPNIIYIGSEGNGVYKSNDGGKTWSLANKGMLDYRITSLAVDPVHSQTVYAGGQNGKLFKSTDSGGTWSDITNNLPYADDYTASDISHIEIDPAMPDNLFLLVDDKGLFVSADSGMTWELFGKPGVIYYPKFTAMSFAFDPKPAVVAGIDGEGGWRYNVASTSTYASTPIATIPPQTPTSTSMPIPSPNHTYMSSPPPSIPIQPPTSPIELVDIMGMILILVGSISAVLTSIKKDIIIEFGIPEKRLKYAGGVGILLVIIGAYMLLRSHGLL